MYKFDLSSISFSANAVSKAKLSLYCLGGTYGVEKTFAYRITKDWKANEATWVNSKSGEKWDPSAGDNDQGGAFTKDDGAETGYADESTWETYDVTKILKYFLNNKDKNFGFLVEGDDAPGHTQRLYASSDYTIDKSQRPKLEITYSTAINYVPQVDLKEKINLRMTNSKVNFSVPFDNYEISLSNAKGQRIMRLTENASKEHAISLNSLPAGVVFMKVSHAAMSETMQFIVAK